MRQKRISLIILAVGFLLVAITGVLLTTPVKAQCGSQTSSCKNCHETQAQKPVNYDGTTWHTQHAFGDFCYLCHAGNNQATDITAAHTGLVDPLTDIATNCKSCHPKDFTAKAQIYATTLGVTLGTGSTTGVASPVATSASAVTSPITAPAVPVAVIPSSDMVDYSQRYDAVALGKQPVNVGNIILIVVLAALVLGGGFFVLRREGWINISFEDPRRVTLQEKQAKYPADVLELLPVLGKLKPDSRRTLKNILGKPEAASDLLASIEKLTRVEPTEPSGGEPAEEENEEKDA